VCVYPSTHTHTQDTHTTGAVTGTGKYKCRKPETKLLREPLTHLHVPRHIRPGPACRDRARARGNTHTHTHIPPTNTYGWPPPTHTSRSAVPSLCTSETENTHTHTHTHRPYMYHIYQHFHIRGWLTHEDKTNTQTHSCEHVSLLSLLLKHESLLKHTPSSRVIYRYRH
jgi:hypothetical protein